MYNHGSHWPYFLSVRKRKKQELKMKWKSKERKRRGGNENQTELMVRSKTFSSSVATSDLY